MTTRRRGSITLEFAFALPIVLVLLVGVVEWGWLLTREVALVQVAREAAHAGSRTQVTDDPIGAAQARAVADLQKAHFDPDLVVVTATMFTSDAGEALKVQVVTDYEPLVGLLPTPPELSAETTMRLEDQ